MIPRWSSSCRSSRSPLAAILRVHARVGMKRYTKLCGTNECRAGKAVSPHSRRYLVPPLWVAIVRTLRAGAHMLATHGVKLGERTETGASAKEDWMAIDGDHVVAGDPQGQATFETHQTPSSAVASPYLVCWAPPAHVFCQGFPIRHIHRLAVVLLACDKKERDPSLKLFLLAPYPSFLSPALVSPATHQSWLVYVPTASRQPRNPPQSQNSAPMELDDTTQPGAP